MPREVSACPHTDRPHYAFGLCSVCYQRRRRAVDPFPSMVKRTHDPDAHRASRLRRHYGISPQDYDRMLDEQGGVCAVCGGPPLGRWNRYAVDHDHRSGRVRGLLCTRCNRVAGLLTDNPWLALQLYEYLDDAERRL